MKTEKNNNYKNRNKNIYPKTCFFINFKYLVNLCCMRKKNY